MATASMWRRRAVCLALAGIAIALGLTLRLARLGWPALLVKYGGSTLWAVMIYWLVAALLVTARPARVAVVSAAIAVIVEFLKLVHTPAHKPS